MRKVSDYIGKNLISTDDGQVLGKITGVLCDNRIRSINYFTFVTGNADEKEFSAVPPKSLKPKNDNELILSNILCIKNSDDFDSAQCVSLGVDSAVIFSDGNSGKLSDIYFAETKKSIEGLLVDGAIIPIERVDKTEKDVIFLLPEGRKRRSKSQTVKETVEPENEASDKVIEKPEADYLVEVLPKPFPPESAAVALQPDETVPVATTPAPAASSLPNKFIGNYRFLLGRIVTANIYNIRRELLIKAGSLITAEVVLAAHKNNKLVELTLYSRT